MSTPTSPRMQHDAPLLDCIHESGMGSDMSQGASAPRLIDPPLELPPRTRNPSARGRQYQLEMLAKEFRAQHADLVTLVSDTESMINSGTPPCELAVQKLQLSHKFNIVNGTAERLTQLGCEENLCPVVTDLNKKVVATIDKIVKLSPLSPRSVKVAHSVASSRLSRTSKVSNASTSSQRVRAAAEAAALRAQLQSRKAEGQLKKAETEARLKLETLQGELEERQLETQLLMEEAKLEVYEREELGGVWSDSKVNLQPTASLHFPVAFQPHPPPSRTHPLTSPFPAPSKPRAQFHESQIQDPEIRQRSSLRHGLDPLAMPQAVAAEPTPRLTDLQTPHVLHPGAPSFHPRNHPPQSSLPFTYDRYTNEPGLHRPAEHAGTSSSNPSSGAVGDSTIEALARAIASTRLPVPEPSVFTGDPLKYPEWKASFTALIENKGVPVSDKIHYLKRYLGGDAREAVSGFFMLSSEQAYETARTTLEQRYGDPFMTSDAFLRRLTDWPQVPSKDRHALQRFSDFLIQCKAAAQELPTLGTLNDIREIQRVSQKLPEWACQRWRRTVACQKKGAGRYPTFSEFVDFVRHESDIANDPVTSIGPPNVPTPPIRQNRNPADKRVFVTVKENPVCLHCNKNGHIASDCRGLAKLDPKMRREWVLKEKLCFACLKPGHMSKQCQDKLTCAQCQRRHPTSLHEDTFQRDKAPDSARTGNMLPGPREQIGRNLKVSSRSPKGTLTSMILPVFVSSKSHPHKEQLVYALIDTMSDSTFVVESAITPLSAPSRTAKLRLTTLTNQNVLINCRRYDDLQVRGFQSSTYVDLPESFTRDHIPVEESHIPTPETARSWPHLQEVTHRLTPRQDCPVGLLIGYNCPQALAPLQCIVGDSNQPFAIETTLGWSVIGGPPSNPSPQTEPFDDLGTSHYSLTKATPTGLVTHVYKTQVQEVTANDFLRVMEKEFGDTDTCVMSQDDHRFLRILSTSVHQREDGFYELPLPFKSDNPTLPNNRHGALHRALTLRNQLLKRPEYKEHYLAFMKEIIENGEAEKVPPEEIHSSSIRWYIPHHGVYHPEKANKVRVVFDCSARYQKHSLNDHLLQGPDLINPLVGVLCRFRKGSIAFTCDIQRMYHQFRVPKEQQDFLRFLWWEGGDLSKPPADYRMKVHLFGATSSPGCANFALKQIAKDHRYVCAKTADFLERNFYVDDGLQAVESVSEAKEVLLNARSICAKANLKLHKVASNNREILRDIPTDERARSDQHSVDLDSGDEMMENTLGMRWYTTDDLLSFKLRLREKPLTRRGMLATVASVYDPLGLIAPVVLVGRQILQAMCKQKLDWDDPVPENLRARWDQWVGELSQVQDIRVPRCYHPISFGEPVSAQLHHFSDASTTGCGQCSYLRLTNEQGSIHCTLVMAKTRVVPIKPVTVPRLELQAAVLSVKTARLLQAELDYTDLTHHFWTDSKVVLGYIKNESKRFHMFVANRVQLIRQHSEPQEWNYVSTSQNPADHASRGLSVANLNSSNWIQGPEFLWKPEIVAETVSTELTEDDAEVKSTVAFSTQLVHQTSFEDRVRRFSSYEKLISAVKTIVKYCARRKGETMSELEAATRAEANTVRTIQREFFPADSQQPLKELDPFRDSDGLLRVGGRTKKSSEPYKVKHPLILPKDSHLSHLIALSQHNWVAHQGRNMTINQIRSSGFWIIGCRRVASSVISNCVKCRKQRGTRTTQKMANLPEERVNPSPPFTHCGIDCFGPFPVKEGRKEMKRYGLLVTCLASRAIHIEILDDLSTDALLNSLRCVIAIRGKIRTIFCDQGTNFVGAKNELKKNLESMDSSSLAAKLLEYQCEFKFNVPSSSHMGGVWERQIRTARNVLTGLLEQPSTRLDTSSLRTLMYEVMAIVNSRPLTVDNIERADGPLPLTPNHILTMKSGPIMPSAPGVFCKEDLYLRKRWKRVQYLANQFWKRWRKEYLQSLQSRTTWKRQEQNIAPDDIVLLGDENEHRNTWKTARVLETLPSEDGLVRKVKLLMSTSALDTRGRPTQQRTILERPIHKVVILIKKDAHPTAAS